MTFGSGERLSSPFAWEIQFKTNYSIFYKKESYWSLLQYICFLMCLFWCAYELLEFLSCFILCFLYCHFYTALSFFYIAWNMLVFGHNKIFVGAFPPPSVQLKRGKNKNPREILQAPFWSPSRWVWCECKQKIKLLFQGLAQRPLLKSIPLPWGWKETENLFPFSWQDKEPKAVHFQRHCKIQTSLQSKVTELRKICIYIMYTYIYI